MDPRYTPGYEPSVTAFMARRSAESHAAFLLPHLRPHWRVLDVGCGPGTITTDLAARVPEGQVLGVDLSADQVARARQRARDRNLTNVEFAVMALGALTLPPGSFDLVFAHAVFEHLPAPLAALAELRACLRPGGLVALRSPDWGGFVLHPQTPAVASAIADYQALQAGNGGDPQVGRKLAGWLDQPGWTRVARSATYEIYPDTPLIAGYLAAQLEQAGQGGAAQALRGWGGAPGATFAQAWFEVIASKTEAPDRVGP